MQITINDILQEYSSIEIIEALEAHKVKNESALIVALKFTRWHKLLDSIEKDKQMSALVEKIKRIRNQYGFPIWLINKALKYYNNDEEKAIERLKEIYCAAGDHPDIYIKRSIEKFMKEIKHQKVEDKIDEIRLYLDNNLHPLVSPNNWQVYSDLVDMIDELGELIEENG